jgi:hypothetical protein
MLGRFNKIFGITDDLVTERGRFVQRINQTAFRRIQERQTYRGVFERVCYLLGVNAHDLIGEANRHNISPTFVPGLRTLTRNDFMETLKVSVLLYQTLDPLPQQQSEFVDGIEAALENATLDLGVRWQEGMFYPTGAKELDQPLIEEPLQWLKDFPAEKADYLKALQDYAAKNFGEVIGNCYNVVEGVARNVLNNSRVLDNNREELLKRIGLSQEWKGLLNNFITYANEFKRHASEKRHDVNPIEVEGFLYMTGLLVRMIIEADKRPPNALARG